MGWGTLCDTHIGSVNGSKITLCHNNDINIYLLCKKKTFQFNNSNRFNRTLQLRMADFGKFLLNWPHKAYEMTWFYEVYPHCTLARSEFDYCHASSFKRRIDLPH